MDRGLLASIEDAELRQAYLTWCKECPDPGHLPAVERLDPSSFMNLLGRLSVVEVERFTEATRFRYRLQGVAVPLGTGPLTGEWARDWTGRYLDQIAMPRFVATASHWFGRAADLCRPVRRVMSGNFDGYELQDYEVLGLPWGTGQRTERLLIASRPLARCTTPQPRPEPLSSVDLYHSQF